MDTLQTALRALLHHAPGAQDVVADAVRTALHTAVQERRLVVPEGISGHGTALGYALAEMGGAAQGEAWHLDRLVGWMVRCVEMDLGIFQSRLQRAEPHQDSDAVDAAVARTVEGRILAGCFGDTVPDTTDLVTSAWNGRRHTLSITGWKARVEQPVGGVSIRLGSVRFPIAAANAPAALTATLRLRSGTLLVGSDVPDAGLAQACVDLRQAADGQGLEGEIAVTKRLLGERQIMAFGVHHRSLVFVERPNGFAIVAPGKADTESPNSFLLDYRHLAVVDSAALLANLAESWEEPAALTQAKHDRALAAFTGKRFQVAPGSYHVALPTNFERALRRERDGTVVLLDATRTTEP
jgi:hypothetical protein